jgi:hypothetical protein|tara:strand:+ start:4747 stop:5037 length:291 start_codon:yes stop_codon:yes gene_type:complete
MFIITVEGKQNEGAYSVVDKRGNTVIYLFKEEDDATRFALLLEEENSHKESDINVVHVDDDVIVKVCDMHNCSYSIITPNDIVIPPRQDNDTLSKN